MTKQKGKLPPDDDVRVVPLASIRIDGGTQTRVGGVSQDAAADFAATYREAPSVMPPLDCVYDGTHYWLYDGFHRHRAASLAGLKEVRVRVFVGTLDDALYRAGAANKDQHGGRRTNPDKRRCVEVAFRSQQSRLKSDSTIADDCGVGRSLVADVRKRLAESASEPASTRRLGADGRTIDVSNIGKNQKPAETPPPPPADDTSLDWMAPRPPWTPAEAATAAEGEEGEEDDYEPPHLTPQEQQQAAENLIKMAHDGTLPVVSPSAALVLPPPQDSWGIPIQPHAAAAFAPEVTAEFRRVAGLLRQAQQALTALCESPGGKHLLKRCQWVRSQNKAGGRWVLAALDNALREIEDARPAVTDCPYAHNDEREHPERCQLCHNARWLGSPRGHQIPPSLKRAMLEHYGVSDGDGGQEDQKEAQA